MTKRLGIWLSCLSSTLLLLHATAAMAGQPKQQVVPGPVPAQIAAAKRVFIANAGENQPFEDGSIFTGGPERTYSEFYAGLKAAGHYELVSGPGDADIILEISLAAPKAGPRISQEPPVFGDAPYDPQLRLVIRDPKTNLLLWVYTQHIQWAILQGNRDKNFEQAMTFMVNYVQGLAVRALAANTAKP
jgi:hypothetical protein